MNYQLFWRQCEGRLAMVKENTNTSQQNIMHYQKIPKYFLVPVSGMEMKAG